jgi:hypothetical protein
MEVTPLPSYKEEGTVLSQAIKQFHLEFDDSTRYQYSDLTWKYKVEAAVDRMKRIIFENKSLVKKRSSQRSWTMVDKDIKQYLPVEQLLKGKFSESESSPEGAILHVLLRIYPECMDIYPKAVKTRLLSFCHKPEYVSRIILRARPQLNSTLYRWLNWDFRRLAMYVACVARSTFGNTNVVKLLYYRQHDAFRIMISYL